MSIDAWITRTPRAFDPELGEAARQAVPGLSKPMGDLIAGTAGSSPYLNGLIHAQADWLPQALADPEGALKAERAALQETAPDELASALRRAKARHALAIALADLSGSWAVDQVTWVLTEFADQATDLALKAALAPLIRRGKLPGQTEDDLETAAGMTVLAMGKMGAHELNYSSDIDLICLFDETRYDPDDFFEARQSLVKATRNMCAMLSDRTAEGYVFRTDLRLRPDPSVTPVVIAMEAAERYYESLGRTWERAAYIKARPCAGDLAAGERFLKTLTPFVWRKHLDFAAIEDAHDMRLRIRDHKGYVGPINVPGHDMKLGRGGIREIEFFTQTRQLISGGRDPDLRSRMTWQGLATLADKGWVPTDVARTLIDHYRAHREVEHRIQMVHDAQTHIFPNTADGIARVACLMDSDPADLQNQIKSRLTEVHELTEGFFAGSALKSAPAPDADLGDLDPDLLARWLTYPALRSERARTLFDRLKPELLARVAKTAKPEETLAALDGFLRGLPAGVQIFSLFQSNHLLIDLLVDIAGTSPALASYLSRNASVFDAVIGGDFFADWKEGAELRDELAEKMARDEDYERKLDTARAWTKDWHFRIGVHHLRGLLDYGREGHYYTVLARAVIQALWPVVIDQFALKHGPPPGRGAAIVGMGSLGSGRMTATSDLDMIVIYDPGEAEYSEGPRPLAARPYYARLTQAMITALTAPMSQGRLYEVDMRLRPSGNQGPVATSLTSFRNYQQDEAWIWEHLALTRAQVVAGPPDLAADIEAFRSELLARPRDLKEVLRAVDDMRKRIADAKAPDGIWDTKTGAGRLQDIDLVAQAASLLSGKGSREVPGSLLAGKAVGWLTADEAVELAKAYWLYVRILYATRLLTPGAVSDDTLGEGALAFLLRASPAENVEALRASLQDHYERVDAIVSAAIRREIDT
ncbi:glutamine-synthetase adenylyltransferase [Aestuariivita boseongensis]|uniref:[protein-PII] uridylyltransferase family protein n=1 Tax=Aestuariivita boseongensis TaxID=1470562 RepID=UPI0006832C9C|nr:glutamine-synthetase adenylyltransferase [Aestuariivita boseongensis]